MFHQKLFLGFIFKNELFQDLLAFHSIARLMSFILSSRKTHMLSLSILVSNYAMQPFDDVLISQSFQFVLLGVKM